MNIRNLLIIAVLLFSQTVNAQNTRIQIINNCPEVALQGIDIYIDGQLVADDLFFRNATAYFDIQAGNLLRVNVVENTAVDTNSAFYSTNITLNANNKYVIIANGLKNTSGYSPATPFNLHVFNQAKEVSAQSGFSDVLFFNGATDGPVFDARTGINTIAKQLSFGSFDNDYFEIPATGTFNIRFTNNRGNITTHNFEGDFGNIGMQDQAVVLLTSGFVNTANNSNGAPFGLWAASPVGGALIEIQATTNREPLARIQFIHNSADTAVGKIDLLLNSNKTVDTLDYMYATKFMDINTGTNIPLQAAHPGQSPFSTTNVNIDSGKTYIAVVHGLSSDTNYKPLEPFKITVFNDAKEEAAVANNTEVVFMHGATDVPVANISEGTNTVAGSLAYGSFNSSYSAYPTSIPTVFKVDTGISNTILDNYLAQYNVWNATGKTAVILLSGFAVPDSNSGGPAFGLWAATSDGGALYQLPIFNSVSEVTKGANQLKVWPNPVTGTLAFEKTADKVDVFITDVMGRVIIQEKEYRNNSINVSSLSNGSYFIIVADKEKKLITNFIKQ